MGPTWLRASWHAATRRLDVGVKAHATRRERTILLKSSGERNAPRLYWMSDALMEVVSVTDYGALAEVYEWLISDARLTPAECVATFDDVIEPLPTAAAVLDCACGIGQLAVGLAGRGMQVVASDASEAMVRRTGELAQEFGASLRTVRAAWDELPGYFDCPWP